MDLLQLFTKESLTEPRETAEEFLARRSKEQYEWFKSVLSTLEAKELISEAIFKQNGIMEAPIKKARSKYDAQEVEDALRALRNLKHLHPAPKIDKELVETLDVF